MLDAMQNAILNKPDSILEKRPNSPSAEITKLENKFENILAKQVKESQAKEAQNKEAQTSIKESKADSKGKNNANVKSSKLPTQSATTKNAAVNKSANTPFDFKDKENVSEESKIGLQEKIAKSSKEVKPQDNPLLEALSAPLSAGATSSPKVFSDKKEAKAENKNQNTLAQKLPRSTTLPQPQKAQRDTTQDPKTLGDVESLAKSKGLNPGKITLQNAENPSTQTQEIAQEVRESKPKSIPASAKESISYEYENNVDRIAIVQRGVKKPKNITSKISNEYPTKKSDDEGTGAFFLKDRPQIG